MNGLREFTLTTWQSYQYNNFAGLDFFDAESRTKSTFDTLDNDLTCLSIINTTMKGVHLPTTKCVPSPEKKGPFTHAKLHQKISTDRLPLKKFL